MGYAFVGVARFSARYRATSAPLVAVGRDRIIVLPWVARRLTVPRPVAPVAFRQVLRLWLRPKG